MKWNEFINKLIDAKKLKKNKGLSVSVIASLIYAGAFDDMIMEKNANVIEQYNGMFEEVKKALGSSASLPKKKKTDIIGLADVKKPADLALWRYQVNPFGVFDLMQQYKKQLLMLGYEERYGKRSMAKPSVEKNPPTLLMDNPSVIYTDYKNSKYFETFVNKTNKLDIIGIVAEVSLRKYQGDKEFLTLSIFTGSEIVSNLVVWPKWGEKKISEVYKSIQPRDVGIIGIIPTIRNNTPGGNVVRWTNL